MYEQHIARCKGLRVAYCDAALALASEQPCVPDFDKDYDDYPDKGSWPPEDWRANIACPRCLCIREYSATDVWSEYSEEREPQPKCLKVEMGCAKLDCKLPVRFFLLPVKFGYCRPSGDDVDLDSDIIPLLRDDRFNGKCPRGHNLDRLPRDLYRVTQQTEYIPSHHADLNWIKHSSRLIRSA
jgi:hypothetical protein